MNYLLTLFSDTRQLLRANMVLIQPLILYFIVILLIMMPIGTLVEKGIPLSESYKTLLIVFLCIGLVSVVFNSGWYNMFHKAVKTPLDPALTKHEQALKSFELFKEFFPGISLYFPAFLLGSILFAAFIVFIFFSSISIGVEQIGIPTGIDWNRFFDPEQSVDSLKKYIESIPAGLQYQIVQWEFLFFITFMINFLLNYFFMFWAQLVIFMKLNFLKAFTKSLLLVARHPLRTLIIILSYSLSWKVAFIIFGIPFILFQFLGIVFIVFVMTFFNLMIFVYLEKQTIDNNLGADSFR